MANPRQSIRQRYLTLEEINSKDPIPQTPGPCPFTAPASVNIPGPKNSSESELPMACSTPGAIVPLIRRLSSFANFEKIPGGLVSSLSDGIQDHPQESHHPGWRNDEPCPGGSFRNHHLFGSVWWEKSCILVVDNNTIGPKSTAPMIEPLDKLSDFQNADCKTERDEARLSYPIILKTKGSSRHLKESQDQGQNFITPKISFEETCGEILDNPQPRVVESLFQRTDPSVPISDSDLESLQSVSEPGSDSESWVNEPTIAELEGKVQTKEEQLKELSRRLEAGSKRDLVQQFPKEMLLYKERQEFFTAAKVSSAVQAQPSKLPKATNQNDPLKKSTEHASQPGPRTLNEVPCYCQGDLKDDEIRVPLPILKIQIRNLRQQITEISEERKHYKETHEKLRGQFYSVLSRKPEFSTSHESATVSALRQEIALLEKVRSGLSKNLNNLEAHCKEEKKVHNSISASLVAKHDSLMKEHTQLKEEFKSLVRALMDARSARLNQEWLQQNITDLKDLIEKMDETQTARYKALETQASSICSQKTTTPKLYTKTSAIALDTTKLVAGLPAPKDERSDHALLLRAYFRLEEKHHKTKKIQSELEETVSEQKLAATNALLEKRQLHNRITELTQKYNSNPLQALTLPSISPSSASSPLFPFSTDTTSKTIAKLNHRLTSENARLTRAAESDATIRDCQGDKINQLTQRCAHAHAVNEELSREMATLSTAHQKLEKAHAIAQEAYKDLERSAARAVRSVPTGSSSGVMVVRAEDPAASARLDLVYGRGKEVDAGQSRAVSASKAQACPQNVPAVLVSSMGECSAAVRKAKFAAPVTVAAGFGVGQREDDCATPGNSDIEY